MARCRLHNTDLETAEALMLHILEHQILMEELMTGFANDQAHLDSDVTALTEAFGTAVTELKAAIANNPTAPVSSLDFSKLDSLVGTAQAEAAADAAPVKTAVVEAPVTNQQANTGQAPVVEAPTAAPVDAPATETPAPAASQVTEAPSGGTWTEPTATA
jgi:hypothetical protein